MRVIAVAGMPGSGKSEAMLVAAKHGMPVLRMGDLIWEEVERQGLPKDASNVGRVAHAMRESHGKDIWSRRTVERAREIDADLILIDGVRNPEEVDVLREELGEDFVLVAILADDDVRHQRLLSRGRDDDPVEKSDVVARDERELGWGLQAVIDAADETLVNNNGLDAFAADFDALLQRIQ